MSKVNFFTEDIDFKLSHPRKTANWIKAAIKKEKKKLTQLNFILCSDDYLREINIQYLKHKTYTDIITFNTSEDSSIEGDIFISLHRVKENALRFERPFEEELHRVLIHGVLHLVGYNDKSSVQRNNMRKKEDAYLSLRSTTVPRGT